MTANESRVKVPESSNPTGGDAIAATGQPILLTHGARTPKAFVLLHGFTASPTQLVELGRQLHARGSNVLIPRLPRHGHENRLTEVLQHLTAEELTAFAHASLASGRELGEKTVVLGFSIGGLLAALLAQRESFHRVVAVAPFLGLTFVPHRLGSGAARLLLRLPNRFLWWHPFLRERLMPAHGYPRYPTHAVAQMYRLALELFRQAAESAPATHEIDFVLNQSELVVRNRSAIRLAALWRRDPRVKVNVHRLRWLPPSHDIVEPERSPWILSRVYPTLVELADR